MRNAGRICCALATLWASTAFLAAGGILFKNKSAEGATVSVVGTDGVTYPDPQQPATCPPGGHVIVKFSCREIKNAYANFADGKVVGYGTQSILNEKGVILTFTKEAIETSFSTK